MLTTASSLPRTVLAALLVLACTAAGAQTPAKPAKPPAPAPKAAEGKTLSLGGGAGSDSRILTRDELRQCIKRQETLATRRAEVEGQRDPLAKEKEALVQEQEALKADREKMEALRQTIKDLNARFTAYADRVNAFNDRSKAVQDKTGRSADRERDALERERGELQKEQTALEAERTKLGDAAQQQQVEAFNARATALDQRVADWNQRNGALVEAAQAVNKERDSWVAECGDRRYREEDEIAIRKGK